MKHRDYRVTRKGLLVRLLQRGTAAYGVFGHGTSSDKH